MSQILVELQETFGSDESIANAARTSTYDKSIREQKSHDEVKNIELVTRLARDGHGTPFESVIFRFWIKLPIFVDRQHMTHRMASHNGLSGRYRTMPNEWFNIPDDVADIIERSYAEFATGDYEDICTKAYEDYDDAIIKLKESEKDKLISNAEFKRAREVLRGMLPTAGMTERTTIMNLRSFANYQKQRNSDHAQPEIRYIAEQMLKAVEESNVCPAAIKALKELDWKI